MLKSNWMLPSPTYDQAAVQTLADSLGILPPTAALLLARGVRDAEEAKRFLHPAADCFHDPFLLLDMDKAVERIERAIGSGEGIVVYGDYDVDGVTSTSILCLYLRERGASPDFYIPDRLKEGYGVSADAVRRFAGEGKTLMITVDTGTTAVEEVALAASLGIDTVVTDHHACHRELPPAIAVVNPMRSPMGEDLQYPFGGLAGVGVTFKLLCAMEMRRQGSASRSEIVSAMMEKYGDLTAIGTVADVMPVMDENRYIISAGLEIAQKTRRPGLAALMEMAMGSSGEREKGGAGKPSKYPPKKRPLTTASVGFAIAPRLNAAGRMASASRAAELFLTSSVFEGQEIASELCNLNLCRQEEEQKIFGEAAAMIDGTLRPEDRIIILHKDGWHQGVIGIVASRLTERYRLPVILISFEGDHGKGSGRSVRGLHLVEALSCCGEHLLKFGGHELAAGLSIHRGQMEAFEEKIKAYAAEKLPERAGDALLTVDAQLAPGELSLRLAQEIEGLEPFGNAGARPLFVTSSLTVRSVIPLSGGKHTKLLLTGEDVSPEVPPFTLLAFGKSPIELGIREDDVIDIVYQLGVNEFQGVRSLQLLLKEFSFSEQILQEEEAQEALHRAIADASAPFSSQTPLPPDLLPDREDLVAVYSFFRRVGGEAPVTVTFRCLRICREDGELLPPLKIRLALDIFNEVGILTLTQESALPASAAVKLNRVKTKMNIEGSAFYKRLRSRLRTPNVR